MDRNHWPHCPEYARFSEDLDFALNEPSIHFNWTPYLQALKVELEAYGYNLEIEDRKSRTSVKVGFIKDDSIGNLLIVSPRSSGQKKLKIKLEIDTNPPAGAVSEQKYVEFPITTPVIAHDLPSLFAGRSHALLCRAWEKGRDWFDFLWYVSRKTPMNYPLLSNALNQTGPWKDQNIKVTRTWYLQMLREKIQKTHWEKQKDDVSKFLKTNDLVTLEHWNTEFFLNRVDKLEEYCT